MKKIRLIHAFISCFYMVHFILPFSQCLCFTRGVPLSCVLTKRIMKWRNYTGVSSSIGFASGHSTKLFFRNHLIGCRPQYFRSGFIKLLLYWFLPCKISSRMYFSYTYCMTLYHVKCCLRSIVSGIWYQAPKHNPLIIKSLNVIYVCTYKEEHPHLNIEETFRSPAGKTWTTNIVMAQ